MLFVIIATVNFGPLTIGILERTAHVDIEYEEMRGSIFRGFRVKHYNVILSETDSIYGEIADIQYRFNPFTFSLPNLFQINLIEPTVSITKKEATGEKAALTFPHLNIGLRINLKNGKILYKDKNLFTLERISGFVFIDFIGAKVYVNTMNLSLSTEQYPLVITSANVNLGITDKQIEAKSFKIKGPGILLDGEGMYSFSDNRIMLTFNKAKIDLEKIKIHKGTINFFGDVEYRNGYLLPKIQGTADGLYPLDYLKFETTACADTIWVNVFDGEVFDGSLFAQVRILGLQDVEFEANFKGVDMAHVIHHPLPIIIEGFMGYRKNKFVGFIKSPHESGFGVDSLFIYGSTSKSQIILDSLFVMEGIKTLEISGALNSTCDLNIMFNNFNIERFSKYFRTEGRLTGICHLQGDLRNPRTITITSELSATNLSAGDIKVRKFSVSSKNFHINNPTKYLNATLENPSYKNQDLENIIVSIQENKFCIKATKQNDSLSIVGTLDKNWRGVISSLLVAYNGVETKNISPIEFDIINSKISKICLSFIDGTLTGTLSPMTWQLSHGNLKKLGMLLGIQENLQGNLESIFENNRLFIDAQNINFIGLEDGSLYVMGEYKHKGIMVESLIIQDKKKQELSANGFLSQEESNMNVKFSNVGLWVLHFLNNIFRNPDGLMTGELTFRGNLEMFKFHGGGVITNGSCGLDIIAAQFDSIVSTVTFDGDRIIFQSAEGRVSAAHNAKLSNGTRNAKVSAAGIITLEPRFRVRNFNFDFSFKDAPIQFPPFAFGTGSGNFSLGARDEVPYYNGNITVKEAIVPIQFGMKITPEKEEGNDNWTMNLKLKGERNIWLRNREADIEFGGELYIVKENSPLYISGYFETQRGNFYWLNHILKITEGKITFIPEEKIDPELNFWAELNTREGTKIILHCFGVISEPIFEFFTDPPGLYSEQDIVTYLNLNVTWQELESIKSGDYVGKILPNGLVSWLEGDISRRIRRYTGLDYFRIETPFFEPDEKTKLTVGKYISRDLFITYTYDITTFSNEFNVEYFIDDKNGIFISKDEIGEYSLQYRYRIRF